MTAGRRDLTYRMRAAGKRMTQERKLILRVIEENHHLGADEIYRLASTKDPRLNLSTVYRTMALLREIGLVDASALGEDHDHYEARGESHHHAVCLGCGRVVEIPTDGWVDDLASQEGFTVTSAKVELFGYCAACRKGTRRAKARLRKGGSRRDTRTAKVTAGLSHKRAVRPAQPKAIGGQDAVASPSRKVQDS